MSSNNAGEIKLGQIINGITNMLIILSIILSLTFTVLNTNSNPFIKILSIGLSFISIILTTILFLKTVDLTGGMTKCFSFGLDLGTLAMITLITIIGSSFKEMSNIAQILWLVTGLGFSFYSIIDKSNRISRQDFDDLNKPNFIIATTSTVFCFATLRRMEPISRRNVSFILALFLIMILSLFAILPNMLEMELF